MVGSRRNWAGAAIVVFIVGCAEFIWEMSELVAWSGRIGAELERTKKIVQLVARTSVVENGLRFGGREVIEAMLNQSVLGEKQIDSIWVTAREGAIRNTYTSDGLYVGMSAHELSDEGDTLLAWRTIVLANSRLGLLFCVPIEHDDTPMGKLSVTVEADELLRKTFSVNGARGATRAVLSSSPAITALSIAVPGVFGPLYLAVPFASWWLPALLFEIAGLLIFVIVTAILDTLSGARAQKVAASVASYQQALQLAHDIRSPVAALRTLDGRIQELGGEPLRVYRTSVQRIHGIADGLLTRFRAENFGPSYSWLGHVVGRLVEEIRPAMDTKTVAVDEKQVDWDVCVAVRPADLEVGLGNIIRNAVEACQRRVILSWSVQADFVRVRVAHDGSCSGFKAVRHGIGLRALQRIGAFKYEGPLERADNQGRVWVECVLFLRLIEPPVRRARGLILHRQVPLVVLDDDAEVARWLRARLPGHPVQHAWDRPSLLAVLEEIHYRPAQFVVDFWLGPDERPGPELIESAGAQHVTGGRYLVTSVPEEPGVLAAAARWDAPIFPKEVLWHLPVKFSAAVEPYRAVLIDDDPLTCRSWELAASDKGVRLEVVRSLDQMDSLPFAGDPAESTHVYVDGGLTTADMLARLARRGYREIYITTGNPAGVARFARCVHGILDKSPPWSL